MIEFLRTVLDILETALIAMREVMTILLVVLIVMKLAGHLPQSWWVVTAPFWGPLVGWFVVHGGRRLLAGHGD